MAELTVSPGMSGDPYLPAVNALVIAESGAAAGDAVAALAAAGVRMQARIGLAEAARGIDAHAALDLVLIEAGAAPQELIVDLFETVDAAARDRGLSVVAAIAQEQIDAAAALLMGDGVQLLCEPSRADRATAAILARAQARLRKRMLRVRSPMRAAPDADLEPLQRLSEEVARIAEELARFSRGEDAGALSALRDPGSGYRGQESDAPQASAQEIRSVIRARRMRGQFFRSDLFADPAWDMLLDLFASHLERARVSVSSLCIAAAVPPTTALRWIGTLHEAGLFERQADPTDRRRAYIALSPDALDGMRGYLTAVKRQGLPIV